MKTKYRKGISIAAVFLAASLLLTGCFTRPGDPRIDTTSRRSGKQSTSDQTSQDTTSQRKTRRTWSDGTEAAPTQPQQATTETTPTQPQQAATEESKDGPLIYGDSRVPNYIQTDPQWERLEYTWNAKNYIGSPTMWITVDANMYQYYKSLNRYYLPEDYYHYVSDENNEAVIGQIIQNMREIANVMSLDDSAVAREIASFVQQVITYETDSDSTGYMEYPRYPIETLYERQGDCEDTTILMAALLREWGYEVMFLLIPSHAALAIRTTDDYSAGSYYEYNGHRYLYIESTAEGWNIGDIPEDAMHESAQFYPIP